MKYLKYLFFVLLFVAGCSSMNTPTPNIGPMKTNFSNYVPIPDSSGLVFLGNLNNALSGVTSIEPSFDTYLFSALPTVTTNKVVFCQDCSTTALTCAGGGTGTLAFNTGSGWLCLSSSSGGGVPSGPAGGDLAGTYPNPNVTGGTHLGAGTVPNTALATNPLNASNISSGVLGSAEGGAGSVSGALKGNGSGTVSQAACADLSNGATGCSTATGTSGATIPLNNGVNTWAGVQTFTSPPVFSCAGGCTMSGGTCNITNALITASCKVMGCNDTTTSGALFSTTPGSGSATVTLTSGGTNTDVISGCVFWGC